MRISDWSSDVCSSDLSGIGAIAEPARVLDFAEYGVILLLFIIGLELQPSRLWAMRRSVFGVGAGQVFATTAALAAAGIALGLDLRTALVAGFETGRASCRERVGQVV